MRTLISFDKLDRLVGEVLPERALMSTVVPPIAGGAGGLDNPFGGDASGSGANDAADPSAMGDNTAGHNAMDPAATGADNNAVDPSATGDDTAPDVVDNNAAPLPVTAGDNDSPMPGAVDDTAPAAADPAAADPAAVDPAAADPAAVDPAAANPAAVDPAAANPAAVDPAAADPAAADDNVTVTDPVTANDNAAPVGGGHGGSDGTTVISACQSTQTVATGGLVGALGLSSNAQNTNLACEPAASHG